MNRFVYSLHEDSEYAFAYYRNRASRRPRAGETMHGGLPEQRVDTGSTQRSRQIVHVFEPVEDFESRMIVRTGGPGSFRIRKLLLSVF